MEKIQEKINDWHNSDSPQLLHEYLELSKEQFDELMKNINQ